MKFQEVAFTVYPVSNVKRSREFYEKILGLKPGGVYETAEMSWIEYEIGPSALALAFGKGFPKPTAEGACAGLEVDNFDDAVKDLKARNVKFLMEPFETGVCRMAIIADPDGSRIFIHKRNA